MDQEPHRTPLKTGPNRSVLLERSGEGQERVIKRYRAREWWRRPGDRARARGEFRVLEALAARGLAVPRPLELRRVGGAWELACEVVPGATSLTELLERTSPTPVPAPLLAARLGELLARAHAAGTDHPDLHAGNLLVDESGECWLIDFTRARLRGKLGAARMRRDLVNLAADARERVPLVVRKRFFLAWWRSLRRESRPALGSRAALAARIERDARAHRRKQVRRHADRWLRGYDSCRRLCPGAATGLVLRETSPAEEKHLIETMLATGAGTTRNEHPLDSRRVLLVEGNDRLRERWIGMGRARDHHLPAARPLLFLKGDLPRCAFELPAGSRPWSEVRDGTPAGLGRLHGALHDRGFLAPSPESLWATPDGEVLLGPDSRLEEGELAPIGLELDGRDRESYAAAFLAQHVGPSAELELLRRRFADG